MLQLNLFQSRVVEFLVLSTKKDKAKYEKRFASFVEAHNYAQRISKRGCHPVVRRINPETL